MNTYPKLITCLQFFSVTVALFVLANTGLAQVTNGSFESGLTGWTVVNPATVGTGSNQSKTNGPNASLWNGGNQAGNSSIAQSFTTTSGQRYMLQFDYGVFQNKTQNMNATVAGSGTLVNQTVSGTGPGGTNDTTWSRHYFPFVADSGTTSLTFTDMTTVAQSAGADGNLDNVSVTAVGAGIVSPGGGGALGAVGFISGNRALASNGGIATQTNTGAGGVPSRGIDGNTNGNFGASSTTHTQNAAVGNQWNVALPAEYAIDNITIFNRSDCCQDRLVDFDVDLLNSATSANVLNTFDLGNPNQANTNNDGVSDNQANATQAFPRYGLRVNLPVNTIGTDVRITQNAAATLSLAEVQAFGLSSYDQPIGDILAIDLGAGGTSDFVSVETTATLNGTIKLATLPGVQIDFADTFDILSAASISPNFTLDVSMVNFGPTAHRFFSRIVTNQNQEQVLQLVAIVPEPSTFALSALSLLSLGFVGWRRRRR